LLKEVRVKSSKPLTKQWFIPNFEIGRIIIEEEQQGKERADYGKQILKGLSKKINYCFGKGFSVDNLDNMRRFYLSYSTSETVSRNFNTPDFQLSWTHYLFLIKIDNISERKVYEIEAINNNWSVKELQRQFNSALFESLVFSKNKKKK
jgi:hypothetical protein